MRALAFRCRAPGFIFRAGQIFLRLFAAGLFAAAGSGTAFGAGAFTRTVRSRTFTRRFAGAADFIARGFPTGLGISGLAVARASLRAVSVTRAFALRRAVAITSCAGRAMTIRTRAIRRRRKLVHGQFAIAISIELSERLGSTVEFFA